jgi:hypothetical protein
VAELSDEQLLQVAAMAIGLASIKPGGYEDAVGPDGEGCTVEAYGSHLIAYGRAVAAATRAVLAAQPQVGGPEGGWFTIASIAQDMRSRGMAEQAAGDELLKMANNCRAVQTPAPATSDVEREELAQWIENLGDDYNELYPPAANRSKLYRAAELIRTPAPEPAAASGGPSIEDVGPLMSWLVDEACQAADAAQGRAAGMLTWAAQVIGEQVNEDAPEPSHDVEGEIKALMLTHSSVEPVMGTSHILREAAFGTVARAIAARWGRRPVTPDATAPTLAEAREAARQLAGPAAQVVHQFLDALVR